MICAGMVSASRADRLWHCWSSRQTPSSKHSMVRVGSQPGAKVVVPHPQATVAVTVPPSSLELLSPPHPQPEPDDADTLPQPQVPPPLFKHDPPQPHPDVPVISGFCGRMSTS